MFNTVTANDLIMHTRRGCLNQPQEDVKPCPGICRRIPKNRQPQREVKSSWLEFSKRDLGFRKANLGAQHPAPKKG